MSPRKQVSGDLTAAHTGEIHTATDVPCRGVFPRPAPPAGDLPAPRGHPLLARGFCSAFATRAGAAAAPRPAGARAAFVLLTPKRGRGKGPCNAGVPTPGTRGELPTGPGAHLAAGRLSRARPPAAAASIINGGSGVRRLPPRETLPGAEGASLPAPREHWLRWMRRRFPVTAMPGGGAGGAAAVPPLPLLQ